ncbi:MAG: molybdopterin molybdotransferase MoeA, partial [Bacteroidales bacterium]
MISFEEAFTLSIQAAQNSSPGKQKIPIHQSPGSVLQEPILAKQNLPTFSKAAVDGFAILKGDINKELIIAGMITAGQTHNFQIRPGECYRIMTGAAIPANTDIVVMQEYADEKDGKIQIRKTPSKSNIIIEGEDATPGKELLSSGTLIRPKDIGILATAGYNNVLVSHKPAVGILNTGSELVEPGEQATHFNIPNSNGPQTLAQLKQLSIDGNYAGIVPDDPQKTHKMIRQGVEQNDILIITAGVSEGEYDLVAGTLNNLGFDILFDKVAIQPGKPTTLAVKDQKYVFGLPGNPVSSFVIFKLFVEPFIITWMKGRWQNPAIKLPLGKAISRKRSQRAKWIPVNIVNGAIIPVEYHGSAHIHSISLATHILQIPSGTKELKTGDFAFVRPL